MKTSTIKVSAPAWYIVDATGQTIGNVSANIAHVLRGKHKTTFSPHQLCGDHVIVINVEHLAITPQKGIRKSYFDHTGYLGHWRWTSLAEMMKTHPERVIEMAVKGMLPQNRLRFQMLKRLHVLKGPEHKYAPQKPVPLTFTV
jgi:large subunit ribosomal protein L13